MKPKTASKTAPIKTIADLAELVGRDKGTVSRWLKRDDWGFAKQAPWPRSQVPKILRWVADTLSERGGANEPSESTGDETKDLKKQKLREEVRKLRANADQAETALEKERMTLLDAAAVETEWASIGVKIRSGFQNLAPQLVAMALTDGLPHEAAAGFQQKTEQAIAGILRHLSSDGQVEDNEDGA